MGAERTALIRMAVAAIAVLVAVQAFAQTHPSRHASIRALREVLDVPEEQIDFAAAKVRIDHMVDPSINERETLAQIDAMVVEVRSMLPLAASMDQRAAALRAYLYDVGPWNKGRVFGYNFDHPSGTHIPDKLLANYLRTRRGNCVSMPFLYIAMAQKLGLTVGAAAAPAHLFAKLRDEQGTWHNIETTSGGYTRRDTLYQLDHPMSPEALANGIYMRPARQARYGACDGARACRTLLSHRSARTRDCSVRLAS